MSERPILFSSSMVRAILDGRKTQTRRVITKGIVGRLMSGDQRLWPYVADSRPGKTLPIPCPYGVHGDRLWVKEAWDVAAWRPGCVDIRYPGTGDELTVASVGDVTLASFIDGLGKDEKAWFAKGHKPRCPFRRRSPLFMPRWASRITLEVTEIRVERVKDITDEYAKSEGVQPLNGLIAIGNEESLYRIPFIGLWDSINAKRGHSWQSNPWVWCVSFKRITP
jgi:hypothetical protein